MLQAIAAARAAGHHAVLLIQEMVFVRCDLFAALDTLLAVPRCGNHLHTRESGGAVVLGLAGGKLACDGVKQGNK